MNAYVKCEIWGSLDTDEEECRLLVCDAVEYDRNLLTRRNAFPLYSGSKINPEDDETTFLRNVGKLLTTGCHIGRRWYLSNIYIFFLGVTINKWPKMSGYAGVFWG
jgi:hypothetical protein